jgi:hypothetical protein
MLGHGANLLDVPLDIGGDQLAMAAPPALKIDTVVGVAKATDARPALGPLLSETRVLTTGRCEGLLGVLSAQGVLWGAPWTALCGLVTCVLRVGLPPFELLPGCGDGLVGRPLFGGHGTRDRFDQLGLHMEQVGGVVRLHLVFHLAPARYTSLLSYDLISSWHVRAAADTTLPSYGDRSRRSHGVTN